MGKKDIFQEWAITGGLRVRCKRRTVLRWVLPQEQWGLYILPPEVRAFAHPCNVRQCGNAMRACAGWVSGESFKVGSVRIPLALPLRCPQMNHLISVSGIELNAGIREGGR